MLRAIRQSAALQGWPLWMILALNVGALLSGLLAWNARARGEPITESAVMLAAWSAAATYLLFGAVRARCSTLQLSLPLNARRLWTAHVVAVAVMSVFLACVSVGIVMLFAVRRVGATGVDGTGLLAPLAAGLVLAVVLLQSPRADLVRIPFTWGYALWALGVLAAVPGLLLFLRPLPVASVAAPLALALAVAAGVLTRMPAAFSVAAREPSTARAPALAPRAIGIGDEPRWSPWIVARGVTLVISAGAKELINLPLIMLMATTTGGILLLVGEDAVDLRYLYLPLLTAVLFAAVGPRLGRLNSLDPLPLPRQLMFAFLVLPYLAVLCAGYGLGAVGGGIAERRAELVNYCAAGDTHVVLTPLRTRRIAWDGRVPAVVAPWGESHVPPAVPLWRGSRAVLYSPYRMPVGGSRDYVAWQLSRATRDVYGAEVPPGEIADRYLTTGAGEADAVCEMLTLRADHPGLAPRWGGPLFPVLITLVGVPWLLVTALLLRAYRAGTPHGLRQAVMWGLFGLFVLMIIGTAMGIVTRTLPPWLARALVEIAVGRIGESPAAVIATWAGAALLLAAAYRVAQSQFTRMEIPAQPTNYTLVDMLRSGD